MDRLWSIAIESTLALRYQGAAPDCPGHPVVSKSSRSLGEVIHKCPAPSESQEIPRPTAEFRLLFPLASLATSLSLRAPPRDLGRRNGQLGSAWKVWLGLVGWFQAFNMFQLWSLWHGLLRHLQQLLQRQALLWAQLGQACGQGIAWGCPAISLSKYVSNGQRIGKQQIWYIMIYVYIGHLPLWVKNEKCGKRLNERTWQIHYITKWFWKKMQVQHAWHLYRWV